MHNRFAIVTKANKFYEYKKKSFENCEPDYNGSYFKDKYHKIYTVLPPRKPAWDTYTDEQKETLRTANKLPPTCSGSINHWTPPAFAIGPSLARAAWCEGRNSSLAKEVRSMCKRGVKTLKASWFYSAWNIPHGVHGVEKINDDVLKILCLDMQQYYVRLALFMSDKHNYSIMFTDTPDTGEWTINDISQVSLDQWNLVYLPHPAQILCGAMLNNKGNKRYVREGICYCACCCACCC